MAMLTITAVVLVFAGIAAAGIDQCPQSIAGSANVIHFGSYCYEFILDHPGHWHDADMDCKSRGGYLTDIHSYAEQGFLFNSMQTLGFGGDKGVWIGLHDENTDGNWEWSSGAPMNFRNWASDQPGMVGGLEDCAIMESSEAGKWHDYMCEGWWLFAENHGWICKYGETVGK